MSPSVKALFLTLASASLPLCLSTVYAQQSANSENSEPTPWAAASNGDQSVPPPRAAQQNRVTAPSVAPSFVPQRSGDMTPPPPPPNIQRGDQSAQVIPVEQLREQLQAAREDGSLNTTARSLASSEMDLDEMVGVLNFVDLPMNDVLDLLQRLTGKPVLRKSALPGMMSLDSGQALTRAEAITALESLITLNGVSVSPLGEKYLKAVPSTEAQNFTPALIEGSTLGLQPSQQIYSKLFQLDYLSAGEGLAVANPFVSNLVNTSVVAFEKSQTILVTDSLTNLQRIERLLERVDKPAPLHTKMLFFQLRNIPAQDALKRLQAMQNGPVGQRLQGNTTIDADDRTNQLIIYTHPGNEPMLTELIEKVDMDVDPLTRTEMLSVRHADAVELTDIIKEVVTGQEQARDEQNQATTNRRRQQQPQPGAQASASEGPAAQFSEYLTIVADERTNTIVATGTPSDLRLLRELVDRLDALLPQVRIEVVVTEVTLSDNDVSGLSEFGVRYGRTDTMAPDDALYPEGTKEGLGGGTHDVWLSPVFKNGSSITPFGLANFNMEAIFRVAKTNRRVSVLSAPTIVTTHNREATITVGDQRPVVTSTSTSENNPDYQTTQVSFKDVTLELKVKPLIGSNGVIQMEVDQKYDTVSDYAPVGNSVADQPVIATRRATSYVSVGDGQVVALGGLQRVSDNNSKGKVWLLGDIPLLGRLFHPTSKDRQRTELLIFIRPTVMENAGEANMDAQRQIQRNHAREALNRYLETGKFDEPDPETESGVESLPEPAQDRRYLLHRAEPIETESD